MESSIGRRFYPFHEDAPPEAVVIHCSDPRFQKAFQSFIETDLGIQYPAPIVIPGSVSAVSLSLAMPKRLKALRDYIEFMTAGHGSKPPRVIIINHEDCRMYASLTALFQQAIQGQQLYDLRVAMKLIASWVPAIRQIELYMARIDSSDAARKKIFFEKVL